MQKKKSPKISLICALAKNRAIGKDNHLLWNIPEDLKKFKKITLGHPVIMGQKTYESIGKPLPKRFNIVVSKDRNLNIKGCQVCHSINEALEFACKKDDNEIFIIGGGSIYAQTIDKADKLYLTLVEGKYKADTFFPDYSNFDIIAKESKKSGKYKYHFLELEKNVKKHRSKN